ncbi:MAG: adenylate kinase [Candidatus Parvarchaeota archaeon]|nr:adenylate kinase [Candidatus Jingweiarchaeum tengchongense]MCW1298544.1 adenylate kinase [Candidatus Jingweiarchaeum tengchongense]MCW1300210.1 adenylate kinase [Candidatus Jingweiarchaeum tengchongense]MCW1304556.1 adenylate kinase [Candidatus Jingweiarchaeum tengchongense]MCW1305716.1 adenylate kinase [Candidatus Jingweiarchaeum tengchongense]
MGKLVLVLGAQGVGKSVVIQEAIKKVKEQYITVNFGDVVSEIIREKGIGNDRDKFRREAKLDFFKEIQLEAARRIAEMTKEKNVIITSHAVMYRKSGFFPGFPSYLLEILKPVAIVIIYSKPDEIEARRRRDREAGKELDRTRDTVPMEIIKQEQEYSIYITFAYAMFTGCCVKIIENPEGRLESAVDELVDALENLD